MISLQVGYAPPSLNTSSVYSWTGATVPEMAEVIKQYLGPVDVLIFNVGFWGCQHVRQWGNNVHFNSRDAFRARLELQLLESAVKQVCVYHFLSCTHPVWTYVVLFSVVMLRDFVRSLVVRAG